MVDRGRFTRRILDIDATTRDDGEFLQWSDANRRYDHAQVHSHGETSPVFAGTSTLASTPAAKYYRLTGAGSPRVIGISTAAWDDASGALIAVSNIGSNAIVFVNQAIAATAGYRLISEDGNHPILAVGETWILLYDGTTARWRIPAWQVTSSESAATLSESQLRALFFFGFPVGQPILDTAAGINEDDARHISGSWPNA